MLLGKYAHGVSGRLIGLETKRKYGHSLVHYLASGTKHGTTAVEPRGKEIFFCDGAGNSGADGAISTWFFWNSHGGHAGDGREDDVRLPVPSSCSFGTMNALRPVGCDSGQAVLRAHGRWA